MSDETPTAYQVLARKYRPQTFADLIGQEAMVRTLKNAFAADRIAQAFMLTGIRGTGKTTTARIVAKGLNCAAGPTTDPCGTCEPCRAIAAGRHVDVLEMDAASNTRIDDIRAQVLDSVPYAPSSARYKVYIIDEVHMLSTSAFNALLKTLEEPPEHVKFVFATTELRKVPVTVLSRCQRFDLSRVDTDTLSGHLKNITEKEGFTAEESALALIARAAEGSVRDALSLLDQAMAQGEGNTVTAATVQVMLGTADRLRVYALVEEVFAGHTAEALEVLRGYYRDGVDPALALQDMLEAVHRLSVMKSTGAAQEDGTLSAEEKALAAPLATKLSVPHLARAWQMTLKGLEEVRLAPEPLMAAEMLLIRMTHLANSPPPGELLTKLQRDNASSATTGTTASSPAPTAPTAALPSSEPPAEPAPLPAPPTGAAAGPAAAPVDFAALVALFESKREAILTHHLRHSLRLIHYKAGRIQCTLDPACPAHLTSDVTARLQEWTGQRWVISVENGPDAPTLAEQEDARRKQELEEATQHPLVQAALAAFPGATVTELVTEADMQKEQQNLDDYKNSSIIRSQL